MIPEKINISANAEDSKARVSGTGEKELKLYSNVFEVVVTAENGAQKAYTIEVIRKDIDGNIKELSKDNTLSKLEIKGYNFIFDKEISEYTILLKDITKELDITAEASDKNATVTIDNPKTYLKGNNVIKISVVSESGEEKVYKVNAVSVEEQIIKDNNIPFYIIIIIETIVILTSLIVGIILNKKGILILKNRTIKKK